MSGVDFVEATARKLAADRERRDGVRQHAFGWQEKLEPRADNAARRLEDDAVSRPAHASMLPLLAKALTGLGSTFAAADCRVSRLTLPRRAGTDGSEVAMVRGPGDVAALFPPREAGEAAVPAFVLKVGGRARLLEESENMRWATKVLGAARVPRLLSDILEEHESELAALPLEALGLASSEGEQKLCTLADLLLFGAARYGLEDLRTACSTSAPDLLLEVPSVSELIPRAEPPGQPEVRWAARQAAELVGELARQAPPPTGHDYAQPSAGEALGLFDLIPLLERQILQARHPTTSPLHSSVRQQTEDWYRHFSGGSELSEVLDAAKSLRQKLCDLRSADNLGRPALPTASLPRVWSHGGLSPQHFLFRGSTAEDQKFELCACSWSKLSLAPLYADLANLLISLTFETVRLPEPVGALAAAYDATAEAGPSLPVQVCARHLHVSEGTAVRLLGDLCHGQDPTVAQGDAKTSAEALVALAKRASNAAELPPGTWNSDAAWLLALLRGAAPVQAAAAEARKISDALADWSLPRSAVRSKPGLRPGVPRVAPPSSCPARRDRGEAPPRGVQWGWQAVREFRDTVVSSLPTVEGDVPELWPALWLVPCLRSSLELLDAVRVPWAQRPWVLGHIGLLVKKLHVWVDGLASRPEGPRAALHVRLAAAG